METFLLLLSLEPPRRSLDDLRSDGLVVVSATFVVSCSEDDSSCFCCFGGGGGDDEEEDCRRPFVDDRRGFFIASL